MLKRDCGFDMVFYIFDGINISTVFLILNPRTSNKIYPKNIILKYLRIIEDKVTDMLSNPSIIKKINNVNCRDYVHDKEIVELRFTSR